MIFAIDFDGTIVEHKFPEIGALLPGAKETINALVDAGHRVIIWTCRTSQDHAGPNSSIWAVHKFLTENGIKFTTINNNVPDLSFQPSPKVYADVYIDDRNFGGFPGWDYVALAYLGEEPEFLKFKRRAKYNAINTYDLGEVAKLLNKKKFKTT